MIEEWRMQKSECVYRKQICGGQLVWWRRGLVIVRFMMCLVCAIWISPETGRGSNSMVHLQGDKKGGLLRAFWSSRHEETVLRRPPNFVLAFIIIPGCVCQTKPYVHVCMKVICRLQYDWAMDHTGYGRTSYSLHRRV